MQTDPRLRRARLGGRARGAARAGALGRALRCLDPFLPVWRFAPASSRAGRRAERAQWAKRDGRRAARGAGRGGHGGRRARWRARAQAGRLRLGARRPPRPRDAAPAPRRWRRRGRRASIARRPLALQAPDFSKAPVTQRDQARAQARDECAAAELKRARGRRVGAEARHRAATAALSSTAPTSAADLAAARRTAAAAAAASRRRRQMPRAGKQERAALLEAVEADLCALCPDAPTDAHRAR